MDNFHSFNDHHSSPVSLNLGVSVSNDLLSDSMWKRTRLSVQSMVIDYSGGSSEGSRAAKFHSEWPTFISQLKSFHGLYELNLKGCSLKEEQLDTIVDEILLDKDNNMIKLNIENNNISAKNLKMNMEKLLVGNYKLFEIRVEETNKKDQVEFTMIKELWVAEFNRRNAMIAESLRNRNPHFCVNTNHDLPQLSLQMMKHLIDSMPYLTHISFIGWTPPIPTNLVMKKKKVLKDKKRVAVHEEPVNRDAEYMFNGLQNIVEFKAMYMTRRDVEVMRSSLRKHKSIVLSSFASTWFRDVSHSKSLKRIELNDCYIQTVEPETLKVLTSVEIMILSNNMISAIPAEIGSLFNLTTLKLDGNDLDEIPQGIENLVNLRELHLHGNYIKKIPVSIATSLPVLKDFKILNQKWQANGVVIEDEKIELMRQRELKAIQDSGSIGFLELYHYMKLNPYAENIVLSSNVVLEKKKSYFAFMKHSKSVNK